MGKSFKKINYFKSTDAKNKVIYKRKLRRKINDLNNDIGNGSKFKLNINTWDFVRQHSYMSKKDFLKCHADYEKNPQKYFNDFYSDKHNYNKYFRNK